MISIAEAKKLLPLVGEHIELHVFSDDDVTDTYVSWLHDPEVVKYSGQRFKQNTLETCQRYVESFEHVDGVFLLIKEKSTNKSIGTMTVYVNYLHDSADIGIMLGDRSCWGQGFGQESWDLLLDTLLRKVGVRKVTGGTLVHNKGMIKIMERAKMNPDGIRVAQELFDGKACDIVHFAAFRDEL